jgi:hypothetical protein
LHPRRAHCLRDRASFGRVRQVAAADRPTCIVGLIALPWHDQCASPWPGKSKRGEDRSWPSTFAVRRRCRIEGSPLLQSSRFCSSSRQLWNQMVAVRALKTCSHDGMGSRFPIQCLVHALQPGPAGHPVPGHMSISLTTSAVHNVLHDTHILPFITTTKL